MHVLLVYVARMRRGSDNSKQLLSQAAQGCAHPIIIKPIASAVGLGEGEIFMMESLTMVDLMALAGLATFQMVTLLITAFYYSGKIDFLRFR
jgi:hypothetical protein